MPEALLVSIAGAARLLDLSRTTIYALLDQGVLRSVSIGRRRLIPRSELERLAHVDDEPVAEAR